jgi:hypothetical protein
MSPKKHYRALREQLRQLKTAMGRGEKRVIFDGKSVEYRSPEELRLAVREVEQAIRSVQVVRGREAPMTRQIRVTTGKGF